MNVSPGEGPGHDREGPCHRPDPERPTWLAGSCVPPFYRRAQNNFECDATRLNSVILVSLPTGKLLGGSESGERSEPVSARPVGPGRAASDRTEARPTGATGGSGGRGPTGRAEIVRRCGRGSSSTTHPTSRVAQARLTPRRTGTCLLRRVAGSATPLLGSRSRDAPESGVGR